MSTRTSPPAARAAIAAAVNAAPIRHEVRIDDSDGLTLRFARSNDAFLFFTALASRDSVLAAAIGEAVDARADGAGVVLRYDGPPVPAGLAATA